MPDNNFFKRAISRNQLNPNYYRAHPSLEHYMALLAQEVSATEHDPNEVWDNIVTNIFDDAYQEFANQCSSEIRNELCLLRILYLNTCQMEEKLSTLGKDIAEAHREELGDNSIIDMDQDIRTNNYRIIYASQTCVDNLDEELRSRVEELCNRAVFQL